MAKGPGRPRKAVSDDVVDAAGKPKSTTSIGIRKDLHQRLSDEADRQGIPLITFTNLLLEQVMNQGTFRVTQPSVEIDWSKRR